MTLQDAHKMCESLLKHHGIHDYSFGWLKSIKQFNTAGKCNWKNKTIKLSPTFVKCNYPVVVKWVMLHEIAHALKPKHRHNKFWKATAKEIGCSSDRCYGNYVKKTPSPENVC